MKRILIILSILFFVCLPASFADVIEPGTRNIDFYYQISNIDNYPQYVFLAHGNPSPQVEILNSSEFSFYKLSTVSIYAIKKTEFNMNDIQLQNFFINNSKLITSNIKLEGSYGNVGMDSSLEKVLIELQIISINNTEMNIKKSRVIYIYADGSKQENNIENQNVLPEPSKQNSLWYFLIPVLAMVVIGILWWRRK